jgi:hypothetical protein
MRTTKGPALEAEPLRVTLTAMIWSDGRMLFTLGSVADAHGFPVELLVARAGVHKIPIVSFPVRETYEAVDNRALTPEAAATLMHIIEAERTKNAEDNIAYRSYLEEQQRLHREKVQADARAAREAERRRQATLRRKLEEEEARRAEEAAVEAAAERARREGNVLSFEKWKASTR